MSDTTPRERRHQRTRDAILKAAIKMIRENGADKLSLRAIAREIDYSPAGLYEYFGSKEEIIQAVCEQGNDYLVRYMTDIPDNLSFEDHLLAMGLAYIRFARENPEMFSLMFNNLQGPSERFTIDDLSEDDSFYVVASYIQSAVELDKIPVEDHIGAIELSYGLWAVVHGMAVLQVTYLGEFPFDYNHADRFTLKAFIRGLMTTKD